MSRSQIDNILAQAAFPKESWDLVVKVIDLFEVGELKAKAKAISKPEFKQQYLQPIQCLPADFQIDKVLNTELSLKELKQEAANYQIIKRPFVV